MFAKDLSVDLLLDFYGDVLAPHTRSLLMQYYQDDLSLSEIAEAEGISRQGVRQAIKKGEEELRFLEEKLGLAAQHRRLRDLAQALQAGARPCLQSAEPACRHLAEEALRCAAVILEEPEP